MRVTARQSSDMLQEWESDTRNRFGYRCFGFFFLQVGRSVGCGPWKNWHDCLIKVAKGAFVCATDKPGGTLRAALCETPTTATAATAATTTKKKQPCPGLTRRRAS